MTHDEAERLFTEAHRLHRRGHNNSAIAAMLDLRRATVVRWLADTVYGDQRGWKRGQPRKHFDEVVFQHICDIKRARLAHSYFVGSEYVQMDYCRLYPGQEKPSLWYIDEVVRRAKLQSRKPRGRQRGGSVYLLYPVECMKRLGPIQQSADFIGKKYLTGSSNPITIFSSCYYRPFKMYQIQRTESEKAAYAIEILLSLWCKYPAPHVFRMDNGGPFRGTGRSPRRLGTFIVFLLNQGIVPLFGSPSKPWTNPAVEGHNRVFTDKVWKKNRFLSVTDIDRENERFNSEGREYFQFRYADLARRYASRRLSAQPKVETSDLRTRRNKKITFVRFVDPSEEESRPHIMIMNERILLPEAYRHQFVFATWNLESERLTVVSEYQGTIHPVLETPFKING